MIFGTIGSIGHGAASPLLWLMFGRITDSFTGIDFDLCSIDFDYLSQMFCPEHIRLNSRHFRREYRYYIRLILSISNRTNLFILLDNVILVNLI